MPTEERPDPEDIAEALREAAQLFDGLEDEMSGDIHPTLARRAAVRCRIAMATDCSIDSLLDAAESLLISAGGLYASTVPERQARATRLFETALAWRQICFPKDRTELQEEGTT
jgi:hypothetical protein